MPAPYPTYKPPQPPTQPPTQPPRPGPKYFWDHPAYAGFRDWVVTNKRQQELFPKPYRPTYWERPSNVAQHYIHWSSQPEQALRPDYYGDIENAYNYFQYRQPNKYWWEWDELPQDDVMRFYLRGIDAPPDLFVGRLDRPAEGGFDRTQIPGRQFEVPQVTGIGAGEFDPTTGVMIGSLDAPVAPPVTAAELQQGTTDEIWAQLPWYNRLALSIFGGGQTPYTEWMPEQITPGAKVGGSLGAVIGLPGGVGGVAAGTGLGMALGSAVERHPNIAHAMAYLDYPALWFEQMMGVMALGVSGISRELREGRGFYGGADASAKLLRNLSEAWEAGVIFEEAMAVELAGDRTWDIGVPGWREAGGIESLEEAWERMMAGEAPEDVYMEMIGRPHPVFPEGAEGAGRLGMLGQLGDLAGHVILDPLNLVGVGLGALAKGAAVLSGNDVLIHATRAALRPTEQFGTYKQFLRLTPEPELAKMTPIQKMIAGVTATGEAKWMLPAKQPTKVQKLTGAGAMGIPLTAFGAWVGGPVGAAIFGGAGTMYGWGKGMPYLFNLTPAARATEVVNGSGTIIAAMLDGMDNSPKVNGHYIRSIANTPAELAREISMASLLSPEASAIPHAAKAFLPKLSKMEDMWFGTADKRMLLSKLAQATDSTIDDIVKQLDETGDAATLFRHFEEVAKQSTDEGAKAVRLAIESGELTPKTMQDLLNLYVKEKVPYSERIYNAQLYAGLMEQVDEFATKWFDVKPDPRVIRMSQAVKSFQSAVLLGLNPTYFLNNVVNNFVTSAASGVMGFRKPSTINEIWQRVGYEPPRMRAGFGPAAGIGGGMELAGTNLQLTAIRSAMRADDSIQVVNDLFSRFAQKAPFTKWSARAESAQSAQAYTSGFLQAFGRLSGRGKGYNLMPNNLVRALDQIDPGLKFLIYDGIDGSMSMKEINDTLFSGVARKHVDSYIPEIANEWGLNPEQIRETLFHHGAYDDIKKALQGDFTDEQIRQVYDDIGEKVQKQLDELTSDRVKADAQEAMTRVQGEGVQAAFEIFDRMSYEGAEHWYSHWVHMNETAGKVQEMASIGMSGGRYWSDQLRLARKRWDRLNTRQQAQLKGMSNALGVESSVSRNIMGRFGAIHKAWDDFYNLRGKLYDDMNLGKISFEDVQARLMEEYHKTFEVQETHYTDLDVQFTEMWVKQYGDLAREPIVAGRAQHKAIRVKMHDDMTRMRTEGGGTWKEFLNDSYLADIAEMHRVATESVAEAIKIAEGRAPEPGPSPAPEAPEISDLDWQLGGDQVRPEEAPTDVVSPESKAVGDFMTPEEHTEMAKAAQEAAQVEEAARTERSNKIAENRANAMEFGIANADESGNYVPASDILIRDVIGEFGDPEKIDLLDPLASDPAAVREAFVERARLQGVKEEVIRQERAYTAQHENWMDSPIDQVPAELGDALQGSLAEMLDEAGEPKLSLLRFMKKEEGLDMKYLSDLTGEATYQNKWGPGLFKQGGMEVDQFGIRLVEEGYLRRVDLDDPNINFLNLLTEMIQDELAGKKKYYSTKKVGPEDIPEWYKKTSVGKIPSGGTKRGVLQQFIRNIIEANDSTAHGNPLKGAEIKIKEEAFRRLEILAEYDEQVANATGFKFLGEEGLPAVHPEMEARVGEIANRLDTLKWMMDEATDVESLDRVVNDIGKVMEDAATDKDLDARFSKEITDLYDRSRIKRDEFVGLLDDEPSPAMIQQEQVELKQAEIEEGLRQVIGDMEERERLLRQYQEWASTVEQATREPGALPAGSHRQAFMDGLTDYFKLPEDEVNAQMAVMDARARSWASYTGNEPDDWWRGYDEHEGRIRGAALGPGRIDDVLYQYDLSPIESFSWRETVPSKAWETNDGRWVVVLVDDEYRVRFIDRQVAKYPSPTTEEVAGLMGRIEKERHPSFKEAAQRINEYNLYPTRHRKKGYPTFDEFGTLYQTPEAYAPTWYRKLTNLVDNIQQETMTVEQLRGMVKKGGIKADELKWSGMDDFLAGKKGKVTKQEVSDYLRQNQVELIERMYGERAIDEAAVTARADQLFDQWVYEKIDDIADRQGIDPEDIDYNEVANTIYYDNAMDTARMEFIVDQEHMAIRHDDPRWWTPGGSNKRELLLTLGEREGRAGLLTELPPGYKVDIDEQRPPQLRYHILPPDQPHGAPFYGSHASPEAATTAALEYLNMQRRKLAEGEQYTSSHYPDDPNLVVHTRMSDYVDVEGYKISHSDEFQADWAQKGWAEGFKAELDLTAVEKELQELNAITWAATDLTPVQRARHTELLSMGVDDTLRKKVQAGMGGVPDVPWKNTWHELALRRMLRYAAENGYDKLTWTTGEQQALRWQKALRDAVDEISVQSNQDGTYTFVARKDNTTPANFNSMKPGEIADWIGKDLTTKLVTEADAVPGTAAVVSGEGIVFGGKFLRTLYDRKIPKYLKKYGKKWGAVVGTTELPSAGKRPWVLYDEMGRAADNFATEEKLLASAGHLMEEGFTYSKEAGPTVHSIDITPEMKQSVLFDGQPLFQRPGAAGPKAGIEIMQDGSALFRALENPDISSTIHETGHLFRKDLYRTYFESRNPQLLEDIKTLEGWVKDEVKAYYKDPEAIAIDDAGNWTRAGEETFARAVERYFADGMAPTPALQGIFDQFKRWMLNIYTTIKGSGIDVNISPELRRVLDRMLTEQADETMGQMGMFGPMDDTPLWSGTPMRGREEAFRPRDVDTTRIMPGMEDAYKPQMKGAVEAMQLVQPEIPEGLNWLLENVTEVVNTGEFSFDGTLPSGMAAKLHTDLFPGPLTKGNKFDKYFIHPENKLLVLPVDTGGEFTYNILLPDKNVSIGKYRGKIWAKVSNLYGESEKVARQYYFGEEPPGQLFQSDWFPTDTGSKRVLGSAYDITDTAEFARWFGESKVVDDEGKPMIVYHGTRGDFTEFDATARGAGFYGEGFYFSSAPEYASFYTEYNLSTGAGANVLPTYLKIENPYILDYNVQGDKLPIEIVNKLPAEIDGYNAWGEIAKVDPADLSKQAMAKIVKDKVYDPREWTRVLIEAGYDGAITKFTEIDEIVAFYPEQIKSQFNGGEFDPNNPNILYQDGDGTVNPAMLAGEDPEAAQLPLGTLEAANKEPPIHKAAEEGYDRYVWGILDALEKKMLADDAKVGTSFRDADIPPDVLNEVRSYLAGAGGQKKDIVLMAMKYAENRRDAAMLNYSRRYGLDNAMTAIIPYQFWYTRSMLQWALRAIDRPAWFATYARLRNMQSRTKEAPGFPSRLAKKGFRIPNPFFPDFLGDKIYFDPLHQMFPFEQLAYPFYDKPIQIATQQGRRAVYIIQDWVSEDEITQDQAVEAMNGEGPVWDRAITQAQIEVENEVANPADFLSTITGFMLPVEWWRQYKKGTPENINQLPATRFIQTVTDLAGIPGGINIEKPIRDLLGLDERGKYWEYYIDRELANMAADGSVPTDQAMQAMVERAGPVYEEAYRRVGKYQAIRNLGAFLWTDFFPEGEAEQRAKGQDFSQTIDSGGDLTKWFEENPEYRARLLMSDWDSPEGRMKNFLVGQVWERWHKLDELTKDTLQDQLGEEFYKTFINKGTRSYDAIDNDTLAYWSQVMGGYVPEGEEVDLQPAGPQVELPPPELTEVHTRYLEERDERYPAIFDLQAAYMSLPEKSSLRREFLEQYPELKEYWGWRDDSMYENPELIPYFGKQEVREAPPEIQQSYYEYSYERDRLFPDIFDIQNDYYAKGKAGKREYLKKHPELLAYWQWQYTMLGTFPELLPYLKPSEGMMEEAQTRQRYSDTSGLYLDMSEFSYSLNAAMMEYFYGDGKLGPGARSELYRIYEGSDRPGGDFSTWVDSLFWLYKQ